MNELALFAGGGGGLLGSKLLGWRTVCYVEWNQYAVEIIRARIRDGHLDDAPIWDDVQTFDGHPWAGSVDIITGGFPCQPFSTAGKGLGESDPRNMWPSTIRIIREVRPRWCLLENVPNLVNKPYWGTILADLAQAGFDAEWGVLSAAAVGAPHLRERVWIVAHGDSSRHKDIYPQPTRKQSVSGRSSQMAYSESGEGGLHPRSRKPGQSQADSVWDGEVWERHRIRRDRNDGRGKFSQPENRCEMGNPDCNRSQEQGDQQSETHTSKAGWWATEPELGRVANGVARRVDRLTAIGNGQVPAVVRAAWLLLKERLTTNANPER